MAAQAEGAVTGVTAEALAVEEVALCAQALHDVHPLAAKMAGVAAAEAVPARHALEEERRRKTTRLHHSFVKMPRAAF